MRIGVPRETAAGERRVALAPDQIGKLVRAGFEVAVERDAGAAAFFPDVAYAAAGAAITATAAELYSAADVVAKVRRPSLEEASLLRPGAVLVALMQPAESTELLRFLSERDVSALALERVPRITRAQSMDVLSSQSTVAGYKAALVGAAALGRFLPMLTTAAGSIAPARVFVIGAGVAGLQAIATARRLGAVVSAFDVRPAAKEQVQSLGATFVAADAVSEEAEVAGGYAREQSEREHERTLAAIAAHLPSIDLVISTAQIPGRPAPRLITGAMLRTMRPGSVIVDLAAESGGNCEATVPDESTTAHGVTILGPTNLPATMPVHASQMFGRNVLTLLQHLARDGSIVVDPADEIAGAMLVTRARDAVT